MLVLSRAIWFLVDTAISGYVMILMLRIMMQLVRANAYNPLCQFVLRLTTPLVHPLQNWLPVYRGVDLAIVVLAFAFTLFKIVVYTVILAPFQPSILSLIIWSLAELLQNAASLMTYLVLARVILTLLHNPQLEPMLAVVYALTEPLLGRVRRAVPLIAGFDLSPLIVIVGLGVITLLLVSPLMVYVMAVS
ncbi:MAG: YggT family protein [Pseudomonadota bacterium]|nr:YggT family protein [Pseudomonadota bacterium]